MQASRYFAFIGIGSSLRHCLPPQRRLHNSYKMNSFVTSASSSTRGSSLNPRRRMNQRWVRILIWIGCPSQWCAFAIMAPSAFVRCDAALILASQIFPDSVAIATASGVRPLNGILCAAVSSFLVSGLGDSKIRISAPSIVFVTFASSIVRQEGALGLSLSTLLAGIFLVFLAISGLGAAIPFIPRAIVVGFSTGIAALVVVGLVPNLLGIRPPIPNAGEYLDPLHHSMFRRFRRMRPLWALQR